MTDEHFSYIAYKYGDTVFRIAFNYCKNRADSDDIAQNVLLKYYKSKKDFENEEHIRNWLIKVTVNECKKLLISPWRKNTCSIDEAGNKLTFEKQEESDLYYTVMNLPKKYRVVVYMFYFEDYSVKEISSLLNINASTVRTRLQRAREKLKTNLEEMWSDE